jgi:hypothetical protein
MVRSVHRSIDWENEASPLGSVRPHGSRRHATIVPMHGTAARFRNGGVDGRAII